MTWSPVCERITSWSDGVVTRARQANGPKVSIVVRADGPAAELSRALEARGIHTSVTAELSDAVAAGAGATAFAPAEPPTPERAAALAIACARAATDGAPVVMLAAFEPAGRDAGERAASLAYLRAHGAIICPDPDVWLEAIALVAGYGLPTGPRVAVVAPPGSWLALSATALSAEHATQSERAAPLYRDAASVGPTDTALVDRSEVTRSTPGRVGNARVVPVVGRAESLVDGAQVALVGLRGAIDAATVSGRAAQRIEAGVGAATPEDTAALAAEVDVDRFERQMAQLEDRAGDHETKVMLKAWGVSITRQAVATTPSAATRIAKRAGWPVEIKPWSADVAAEPDGGPVESEVYTAPDVRRSFAAVAKDAGLPPGAPVIVRETPPSGRELRARVVRIGALGWTVIVEIAGAPGPIAAPAPLREIDAREIARFVEATRTTDPEPDRDALVSLLVRASHMVVAHEDRFESLDLARVVVAPRGDGAVVVDARAVLVAAVGDGE
jgi:hypothetical protein